MATLWKAPTIEDTPFEEAVSAVIRASIIPTAQLCPAADADGFVRMVLPNGQEARVAVTLGSPRRTRHEQRTVLSYSVNGYASRGLEGHEFQGVAAIDLATKAFLRCDFTLRSVGQLA